MKLLVGAAVLAGLIVEDKAELGKVCPDFTFKSLDGKSVKLSELRKSDGKEGQITLVVFWSFKCGSGKNVIGRVNEAAAGLEKAGVKLISTCPYGESEDELKKYVENNNIKHDLYYDPDVASAKLFGCKTITCSYLLDKTGKLVYVGNIVSKPNDKSYDGIQAALDLAAGKELKRATVKQGG